MSEPSDQNCAENRRNYRRRSMLRGTPRLHRLSSDDADDDLPAAEAASSIIPRGRSPFFFHLPGSRRLKPGRAAALAGSEQLRGGATVKLFIAVYSVRGVTQRVDKQQR